MQCYIIIINMEINANIYLIFEFVSEPGQSRSKEDEVLLSSVTWTTTVGRLPCLNEVALPRNLSLVVDLEIDVLLVS